ncbi:hypothetical protein [Bacillus mycoides]|uniref:hypothetical protein n=1 Tax=Bacillus mycoides TaxID=1405 RepID=UPI00119FF6B1|nr:hypothetical protein [Bacillus mycoides]
MSVYYVKQVENAMARYVSIADCEKPLPVEFPDGTTINATLGAQEAKTKAVVFHDGVTAVGAGVTFPVESYKTLTIEVYGTSTSREIKFYGIGTSGAKRQITGVNLLDLTMATSTKGTGELWQFEIVGLESVVMELTSVSGGNVTVKGKAVA